MEPHAGYSSTLSKLAKFSWRAATTDSRDASSSSNASTDASLQMDCGSGDGAAMRGSASSAPMLSSVELGEMTSEKADPVPISSCVSDLGGGARAAPSALKPSSVADSAPAALDVWREARASSESCEKLTVDYKFLRQPFSAFNNSQKDFSNYRIVFKMILSLFGIYNLDIKWRDQMFGFFHSICWSWKYSSATRLNHCQNSADQLNRKQLIFENIRK